MNRITYFVDVILPLAVPKLYTYRVPYDLNDELMIGKRVIVQLGKSKLYSALIRTIHETPPPNYTAKYIDSILDEYPIVNEKQFALWQWMSEYYMCHIGEIMVAALPEGLRLASETKIIINPDFNFSDNLTNFTDKEHSLIEALEVREVLSIKDVSAIIEQKTVYPLIKTLIKKGAIVIMEELKEKFKPRLETFIQIVDSVNNETSLHEIFDSLGKRAPKQLEVLMAYNKLSSQNTIDPKASKDGSLPANEVKKSDLLKNISGGDAALKSLEKKNILSCTKQEVGRFSNQVYDVNNSKLNELQATVLASIEQQFGWKNNLPALPEKETKNVTLLHGVTSSGKTEIYVNLMQRAIKEGKQVLYLVPEIALTTQIINRLRAFFGNEVGIYHSKFNGNERVEVWENVLSFDGKYTTPATQNTDQYKLIVGARSSLFLPFSNLGLIIVDEEHDSSYKQFNPSPRYNARDSAIYLAHIHKAKTLLGSATPSLESYFNAKEKKYGFAEIMQRFGGIQMPQIVLSDVKEAKAKKQMKSHFSPILIDNITEALKYKQQVILFQNRRGFAPRLECNMCAWTPQCTNCDVSLTYHKTSNLLRCHYCGYSNVPPKICPACGDTHIKMQGFGTEKIEEELAVYFPDITISRMDLDTTRSKFAHQHIIQDFESGKVDILVGTQMVTKGLDFNNVSLVGILNADSMLNFPDFRAFERSYQLMAQVSGRAGRRNVRGKVIIQTQNPDHTVIQDVIKNDYLSMYHQNLTDRKTFQYPPYFKLIELRVINRDLDLVNLAAKDLADKLKIRFKKRVLGPEFPIVSRIRNLYNKNILLKIEREASVGEAKKIVRQIITAFMAEGTYKGIKIQIDVDPM